MSPSEYRELRRQDEEDASLKRLVKYFFGETWGNIPERAREHLVNADHIWFANARGVVIDAVLNDLQVAVETICYAYIWETLRTSRGGHDVLEFKKRDDYLVQHYRFPTLSDYSWICRQGFFKTFVQSLALEEEEQAFLTSQLESDLSFLRRARDVAQHDPSSRLRREDVETAGKSVHFGIGQPGVLRRLAEIGPKLVGK